MSNNRHWTELLRMQGKPVPEGAEAPSGTHVIKFEDGLGAFPLATGSVAGDELPQPKPLMCRLAAQMQEWRTTRDNIKARGEDDAAIVVECCMETLHEEVSAYLKEMKELRSRSAEPQNNLDQTRGGQRSA